MEETENWYFSRVKEPQVQIKRKIKIVFIKLCDIITLTEYWQNKYFIKDFQNIVLQHLKKVTDNSFIPNEFYSYHIGHYQTNPTTLFYSIGLTEFVVFT